MGADIISYGKEKLEPLVEKYHELKMKSQRKLNDLKNIGIARITEEMQFVIDSLSHEISHERFEGLKEKTKQIVESGEEALRKLRQQLQKNIDAEKLQLERNLDIWWNEAQAIVKDELRPEKRLEYIVCEEH